MFLCVCVFLCILYNRFVVDMCMSSLSRTLLHSFPFLQIPLFLIYSLCLCGFWSGWQPLFRFLLSIYLYYLLRWWCIMIVFKMASIRYNAHIRCQIRRFKALSFGRWQWSTILTRKCKENKKKQVRRGILFIQGIFRDCLRTLHIKPASLIPHKIKLPNSSLIGILKECAHIYLFDNQ